MKIRNGFVSNSSSSSFIAIGMEVKIDDLNYENIYKNLNTHKNKIDKLREELDDDDYYIFKQAIQTSQFDIRDNDEDGYTPEEGYVFIGKTLARGEDDMGEMDASDIAIMKDEIEKLLDISGYEIKIIWGAQLC